MASETQQAAAELGVSGSMPSTEALLQQPLWDPRAYPDGSPEDRVRVSYR